MALPPNCPAGAQTQTCPLLMNVTGTVTVWECNIPPPYCNGASGQNDGPLAGCGCVICQTSEQAALEQAQQILAMQSVSVDSSGPPLQCRGPVATLNQAYDTGPLFTVGECMQVTQATCRPCDDGQGGTLQSVGQYCNTGEGMAPVPGGSQCCAGLTCSSTDGTAGMCTGTLQPCPQAQPNWSAAHTAMLRTICTTNNVNGAASQSGVTLNRTCGVAFEDWVLTTIGVYPKPPGPGRNTMSFPSMERMTANKRPPCVCDPRVRRRPDDVPPERVLRGEGGHGALTPGTSNWQVLGLLDAVNTQITKPAGTHPAPAVFFITLVVPGDPDPAEVD